MTRALLVFALASCLAALSPLHAAGAGRGAKGRVASVYARAAPAVVGIECSLRDERAIYRYFGTGAIIDPDGLVLTSISVVPEAATDIRVYLRGGHSWPAKLLKTVPEKEFALLRIDGGDDFPHLPLGDSDTVRVGQLGLTLGNAFQSIKNDDQVTLASGLVSGRYPLAETRSQAEYIGPVLETTAAVNDGMDGGPLLNGRGEIVGMLSLNFSTTRWLGTAIPINALKPLFGKYRRSFFDRGELMTAFIGVEVVETELADSTPALRVERVDDRGPARLAGLRGGQRIVAVDGEPVTSIEQFRKLLERATPGRRIRLRVASPNVDPRFRAGFTADLPTPVSTPVSTPDPTPDPAAAAETEVSIEVWGRF